MSRTKKGSKPPGYDMGGRYDCDKGYSRSNGKLSKNLADSERRSKGKREINKQLKED
jgi:hypothetical protein